MVFLLKKIQKLYEIRDDLLRIYSLKPDYSELETVKRQYIENSNEDELFYRIISRNNPSWFSKNMSIPISKLDGVAGGRESILTKVDDVPRYKKSMLNIYCKSDLQDSNLKIIFDDKTKEVIHYFLYLSSQYKEGYKLHTYDNILKLSKELFMYELILNNEFSSLDLSDIHGIDKYFGVTLDGHITLKDLYAFDSDIIKHVLVKEGHTHKLVRKIINGD